MSNLLWVMSGFCLFKTVRSLGNADCELASSPKIKVTTNNHLSDNQIALPLKRAIHFCRIRTAATIGFN